MVSFIKGITVKLHVRAKTGVDALGAPVYSTVKVNVENVLVAPVDSSVNSTDTDTRLHGKKAGYTLAIPKGDTHSWDDTFVEFFGQTFRTVGFGMVGIEDMIPLDWNRKVSVERYTGGEHGL